MQSDPEQNPNTLDPKELPSNKEILENPSDLNVPSIDSDTNQSPSPEAPKKNEGRVVQEKGFSYFVGFAFLSLLSILFFFVPGIASVFAIHQINPLNSSTAWIFAAILSVVFWLFFKFKIKGFKKATYWYLAFCLLIFIVLILIHNASESFNVFANLFAMLMGV